MLAHAGPAPLSPIRGLPGILKDRVAIGAALPGFFYSGDSAPARWSLICVIGT
jgi:hypothetical protein